MLEIKKKIFGNIQNIIKFHKIDLKHIEFNELEFLKKPFIKITEKNYDYKKMKKHKFLELIEYIKNENINETVYKRYKLKNNNIGINILIENICDINLKKIYNDIYFISQFFSNFNERQFKIKIYCIENDKYKNYDGKDGVLGYENINSGFALFILGIPQHICLHRNEEYKKVLIHELIHYLCLDYKDKYICECKQKYCYNNVILGNNGYKILYNEGFVEFYATIINLLLLLGTNKKEKYFYNCILIEYYNCIYQLIKIFSFYKITSFELLFQNNNFNQKTNVFGYFFIKYVLFYNIKIIIDDILNFKWIGQNYKKLYKIICDGFNDINFRM